MLWKDFYCIIGCVYSYHDNPLLVASFTLAITPESHSNRLLNYQREIALESNHCEWIFITRSHHFMLFCLFLFCPWRKLSTKRPFVIISFSLENLVLLIIAVGLYYRQPKSITHAHTHTPAEFLKWVSSSCGEHCFILLYSISCKFGFHVT